MFVKNSILNVPLTTVIRGIYVEGKTMGDRNYKASGQKFGGGMNALARSSVSAGVSSYSGSGDSTADAKAIAANRAAMAGNEDPIARANRISKEKKAQAEAKAKAKAAADAVAAAQVQ